jgi:hypothetical protein
VIYRIVEAVAAVDRQMLQRVWQKLDYRIDICRVTKGGHGFIPFVHVYTVHHFHFHFIVPTGALNIKRNLTL